MDGLNGNPLLGAAMIIIAVLAGGVTLFGVPLYLKKKISGDTLITIAGIVAFLAAVLLLAGFKIPISGL